MSSYWNEKIIHHTIEDIAYSVWILVDYNTGSIIDKCYCTSQCCIKEVRECKASSHYCICKYNQTVLGRATCLLLCKGNSHNCLCRRGSSSGIGCKSKHMGGFICRCPNLNIICNYDSDDSDDMDSRHAVRIRGHICICITQGPDTCLAKVHKCSCKNAGFMECLYSRPDTWPCPMPLHHKRTLKNIITQELYCNNPLVTEYGVIDMIMDYVGNPDGIFLGSHIVYNNDSHMTMQILPDSELELYMKTIFGTMKHYFDNGDNQIKCLSEEIESFSTQMN